MDSLGRGSVIGMYNILKEECYSYSAWAVHSNVTVILAISIETITNYRKLKSELDHKINLVEDNLDKNGLP